MEKTLTLSELIGVYLAAFDVSNAFSVGEKIGVTDEDLAKKIQKGDGAAFEHIVDKYTPKMYRYLYYYFNFNGQIAEDVVQDIFVKLWEKIHKYDPKQKFESWLYRFAHNYTIDWIRKYQKDESVAAFSNVLGEKDETGHNFADNFVVSDENVAEQAHKNIKSDLLRQLLEQLDEKYRDVLILFYFEQKSYDEIAYILDIKPAHVGTLLLRGKQKLKSIIDADEGLKATVEFDL